MTSHHLNPGTQYTLATKSTVVETGNKLATKWPVARIIKYADDTTLLVAEKSSADVATEFGHLEDWSRRNKLTINKDKTVEIIFRRPKSRHFLTAAPLWATSV